MTAVHNITPSIDDITKCFKSQQLRHHWLVTKDVFDCILHLLAWAINGKVKDEGQNQHGTLP